MFKVNSYKIRSYYWSVKKLLVKCQEKSSNWFIKIKGINRDLVTRQGIPVEDWQLIKKGMFKMERPANNSKLSAILLPEAEMETLNGPAWESKSEFFLFWLPTFSQSSTEHVEKIAKLFDISGIIIVTDRRGARPLLQSVLATNRLNSASLSKAIAVRLHGT